MAIEKMFDSADPYLKVPTEAGDSGTTQRQFREFVANTFNALLNTVKVVALWQPKTAYNAGTVILSPSMKENTAAYVQTAGTTNSGEPAWTTAGTTVTDGSVKYLMVPRVIFFATDSEIDAGTVANKVVSPAGLKKVSDTLQKNIDAVDGKIKIEIPDSAPAHNALYRGKDLTSYFNSGEMSKAIAAGTFADIFPGDYITKSVTVGDATYSNVKWIIGDLDYHLHRGDTETKAHHVLVFPEGNMGTAKMNETNTTVGGYQGSDMWKTTIPLYTAGIQTAFGTNHVLTHRELLTNGMNADAYSAAGDGWKGSSYWDWNADNAPWQSVIVNIFNSAMMFGSFPFASSGFDTGDCAKQVAAFRHGQNFTRSYWCWLRDVVSATYFASVNSSGYANYCSASAVGGVRPYFLLY